jgi:hypothetical protein
MPEGDVPLAPQLSVTFSQPMVAVTSVDDLAAQDVPVKLNNPLANGVGLERKLCSLFPTDVSLWLRNTL